MKNSDHSEITAGQQSNDPEDQEAIHRIRIYNKIRDPIKIFDNLRQHILLPRRA